MRFVSFRQFFISFMHSRWVFSLRNLGVFNFHKMEDEKKEITAPDELGSIRAMIAEIEPEGDNIVEVVRAVVDRAKKDREVNERLVQAFDDEPRLAQVFMSLLNGDKGAAYEFARTFGREFATAEEGTPEYEQFLAGENARKEEIAKAEEARALLDKNLDDSDAVIEAYCKENNLDADKFREEIDQLLMPIMDGTLTMEACKILDKGLHYDKDTQDAYDAGVVEGRNTNINAMRDDRGDGLPKNFASQQIVEKPRKRNSLIEAALNA